MNEDIKQEKPITQEYVKAKPEVLPGPTYSPFLLAISLLLFGWGLLATWIIAVTGLIGVCIALYGWIKVWLHEREEEH